MEDRFNTISFKISLSICSQIYLHNVFFFSSHELWQPSIGFELELWRLPHSGAQGWSVGRHDVSRLHWIADLPFRDPAVIHRSARLHGAGIKSRGPEGSFLGSGPGSAADQLCDLGQVTQSLCAPDPFYGKWGYSTYFIRAFWRLNKYTYVKLLEPWFDAS